MDFLTQLLNLWAFVGIFLYILLYREKSYNQRSPLGLLSFISVSSVYSVKSVYFTCFDFNYNKGIVNRMEYDQYLLKIFVDHYFCIDTHL